MDVELPLGAPSPSLQSFFSEAEDGFYSRYPWCLNPFLRVDEVISHLRAEIGRLRVVREGWQLGEVRANVFLFACALSDSADDCLNGKRIDLSGLAKSRAVRSVLAVSGAVLAAKHRHVQTRLGALRAWRPRWEEGIHRLLLSCTQDGERDQLGYFEAAQSLAECLDTDFPDEFLQRRIKSPRAFRSQDFTLEDVIALSARFCAQFVSTRQPYLVIGLRTAGSYFGPVLRAYMVNRGYADVGTITLRPKSGISETESDLLRSYAKRGATAIVIDEPLYQGVTLAVCMRQLRQAGFAASSTAVLFPVHLAAREWRYTNARVALNGCTVITMEPEETFRYAYLHGEGVELLLRACFAARGWSRVEFVEDENSRAYARHLARTSDEAFYTRLKRVFAVKLERPTGECVTRYVIGKSVGYGWSGYQAYFTAKALTKFVPPVLSLRNGLLFSEWVGEGPVEPEQCDRPRMLEILAGYVGARVAALGFAEDPSPALCSAELQLGMDMLANTLGGPYRGGVVGRLMKRAIREELSALSSPKPCLIDGKIRAAEWVQTPSGMLKTDFEQHGMGRMAHSITDPAYDLSNAILSFALTQEEEAVLMRRYVELSGDASVAERLPLYKLLAGEAAMGNSLFCLDDPRLAHRYAEFSRTFIDAWTFGMIQMARFCSGFVVRPEPTQKPQLGPVIFCDIDGVIDRHTFRFPTTTEAGIRALSLLHTHGLPVFLNTARSCDDVREYCAAYGLAGGVAESGSCLWDAATSTEKVLIDPETLDEILRVRAALEQLPGVFTNRHYRYSIKAFTYRNGVTVQLQASLVHAVLARVGAKTLGVHQTGTDTAISFRDVDKGTGLQAMLELTGRAGAQTIAVGDSEPDLAMFRVASKSYAPSNVGIKSLARLLGCRVVSTPYQRGFLEIVRHIVHNDGRTCARCTEPRFAAEGHSRLIVDLLSQVDERKAKRVARMMFDPHVIRALVS